MAHLPVLRIVAFLCALALAAPRAVLAASAIGFHCPGSLAQQAVVDRLPAGWSVHGPPAEERLQRIAFYDGDPAGLGALAPDATRRSGLVETSTWTFADGDSARVWLGCLYRDTAAVVARPLPGGLTQCTTVLRLTPLGDPSEAGAVQCR
jgi:hypothetical protein